VVIKETIGAIQSVDCDGDNFVEVEKRKFLTLPGNELQPPGVQPLASRYTDCAIVNKAK
jgi:hypothetical protein